MPYARRREELIWAMERSGWAAVVFGTGANLQYFSGTTTPWTREGEPEEPREVLVLTRAGDAMMITTGDTGQLEGKDISLAVATTESDVVKWLSCALSGSPGGPIGVGKSGRRYLEDLVDRAVPGSSIADAERPGAALRVLKEPGEIDILRRSARLADETMAAVVQRIQPGLTQADLEAFIQRTGIALGAQSVSFPPTAGFVRTGHPAPGGVFNVPADEGLSPGSSIAFDFGFVLDGYCSDFGRSLYCGPAPKAIGSAYRALGRAQEYLIENIRPGVTHLCDLFGMLESHLDDVGFGHRLRARLPDGTLGHQIGVDLHEDPWLRPESTVPVQPGMVMAIEPKLWSPGEYYLRIEDMVLVTENGAESLTTFDRKLFEIPL